MNNPKAPAEAEGDARAVALHGPIDVAFADSWTTEQKLGFIEHCLRWPACGYVNSPERIMSIRLAWKVASNLEKAANAQEPETWALYVAGMVLAYLGGGVDDERIKPIAGIIQRRLWALQPAPARTLTEEQHVAAVKVLLRATGLDGLPQRMLDAMTAAAPSHP